MIWTMSMIADMINARLSDYLEHGEAVSVSPNGYSPPEDEEDPTDDSFMAMMVVNTGEGGHTSAEVRIFRQYIYENPDWAEKIMEHMRAEISSSVDIAKWVQWKECITKHDTKEAA